MTYGEFVLLETLRPSNKTYADVILRRHDEESKRDAKILRFTQNDKERFC